MAEDGFIGDGGAIFIIGIDQVFLILSEGSKRNITEEMGGCVYIMRLLSNFFNVFFLVELFEVELLADDIFLRRFLVFADTRLLFGERLHGVLGRRGFLGGGITIDIVNGFDNIVLYGAGLAKTHHIAGVVAHVNALAGVFEVNS